MFPPMNPVAERLQNEFQTRQLEAKAAEMAEHSEKTNRLMRKLINIIGNLLTSL